MRSKRRRKSGRVKLPAALQGSVDLRNEVTVIDLSMSGAMIDHTERLSPGRTCFLFMPLPSANLRLRAQLVWSQVNNIGNVSQGPGNMRFRSGVHFLKLTEEEAAHLRQYLTILSGRGTGPAGAAILAPDPEEDPSAAAHVPEEEKGLPDSAFFSRFR